MNELFALAEQSFLAGELAEAYGVLESLHKEVMRLKLLGRADEIRPSFPRFKATIARCRRRDQMLFAIYAGVPQEAHFA